MVDILNINIIKLLYYNMKIWRDINQMLSQKENKILKQFYKKKIINANKVKF